MSMIGDLEDKAKDIDPKAVEQWAKEHNVTPEEAVKLMHKDDDKS